MEEIRRGAGSGRLFERFVRVVPAGRRVDSRLITALEQLDDPAVPIAETHRRLGAVARELGLVPPSYEHVRRLVHAYRRLGGYLPTGEVLLDIAFRTRPVMALGDHMAGALPPKKS